MNEAAEARSQDHRIRITCHVQVIPSSHQAQDSLTEDSLFHLLADKSPVVGSSTVNTRRYSLLSFRYEPQTSRHKLQAG